VLFAPAEPEWMSHVHVTTPAGEAWRCLRCGDFTVGEPTASGSVTEIPVVMRGKVLRSRLIMRLLAIERFFRFLLVGAIAYGVWRFSNSEQALRKLFDQDLTVLRPVAQHWGYDLDHSSVVDEMRKIFTYKKSSLTIAAIALAGYAVIELIEGIGLWLAKRWGEYFAVVATALFLPLEVEELLKSQSAFKLVTFALNVAAVLYLILAKRLFGVRGGGKAYEAEGRSEQILDLSAVPVDGVPRQAPGVSNGDLYSPAT
jgi:uncharacterized membrane protein (DUF2068 family)